MRIKIFYDSWEKAPWGGKYFTSAEYKANHFVGQIEKAGGVTLNIDVRNDNSIVVTYKEG